MSPGVKKFVDVALSVLGILFMGAIGLLLLSLFSCAAIARQWMTNGACIPLCQSAQPLRNSGAALFDEKSVTCMCHWEADEFMHLPADDVTIDLRTLTCRELPGAPRKPKESVR